VLYASIHGEAEMGLNAPFGTVQAFTTCTCKRLAPRENGIEAVITNSISFYVEYASLEASFTNVV
jgi:hypothetical protein